MFQKRTATEYDLQATSSPHISQDPHPCTQYYLGRPIRDDLDRLLLFEITGNMHARYHPRRQHLGKLFA